MINEINKDITDSDIDELFNNNNSAVLKNTTIEIPKELSVDNTNNTDYVDRPVKKVTEETRVKNEIQKLDSNIEDKIEKDITSIKGSLNLDQARKYIKKLSQLKNRSREDDQKNKMIINGITPVNVDSGTECTFHLFRPRHIMGDDVECQCEYCSCYKKFTQREWDEYCIKYRKWF